MSDKKVETVPTPVVATARGYYKRIREPGDSFIYPMPVNLKKLPTWMEKAEAVPELELPDEDEDPDE